jgi:IclR family acetate operon transcriptional repressor
MSAITRSVQAMDLLARKGPLGVRAVAQQLSLPLGSVHRLLLDLSEEGIVDRTPSGEWELSYRLLEITGLQLERIELPRLFRPFAETIAAATGETVNLNALSGHFGVCIDKVRGNEGMQLDNRIGSRGPLNCGGAGKAMLAFMDETEREQVFTAPLEALTPYTITDPSRLRDEIGRIRERGYSIDDQEVVLGVWCVSMPMLDRNGRPVGALSITGPSPKKAGPDIAPLVAMLSDACGAISVTGPSLKQPGPGVEPLVVMLQDACRHVSHRLGYSGPWPGEITTTTAERRVG